jgi:hypothetical protein
MKLSLSSNSSSSAANKSSRLSGAASGRRGCGGKLTNDGLLELDAPGLLSSRLFRSEEFLVITGVVTEYITMAIHKLM